MGATPSASLAKLKKSN